MNKAVYNAQCGGYNVGELLFTLKLKKANQHVVKDLIQSFSAFFMKKSAFTVTIKAKDQMLHHIW